MTQQIDPGCLIIFLKDDNKGCQVGILPVGHKDYLVVRTCEGSITISDYDIVAWTEPLFQFRSPQL